MELALREFHSPTNNTLCTVGLYPISSQQTQGTKVAPALLEWVLISLACIQQQSSVKQKFMTYSRT